MCVGVPMRVVEPTGRYALCDGREGRLRIDMILVGDQPAGTWVLTFRGAAQAVLDADEAGRVDQALDALELALRGEPVDHLFPDLVGREPELPEHLRPPPEEGQ